MAAYDGRQMNKMRQDAIQRSQEMHRRSVVNTSHYSQGRQNRPELPPSIPEINNPQAEKAPEELSRLSENHGNKTNPLSSIIEIIAPDGKLDGDKLMIIALMIILAREGADIKLIIALGYILL